MASKSATGDSEISASISPVVGVGLTVVITLAAAIAIGFLAVVIIG